MTTPKKPPKEWNNPWRLTPAELRAVTAMCAHGHCKVAAHVIGVHIRTFGDQLASAKKKMEVRTLVRMAIVFDRWQRETAP